MTEERHVTGNSGEERYKSDFEQWADARDAAREATGGILIESSTDAPEDALIANMMQPQVARDQVVVVSHLVRPDSSGATESERFTVEHFGGIEDGEELRRDHAKFRKNLESFRAETPDFDALVASAGDLQIQDSVRRVIVKADNGPQVFHFLLSSPELVRSLAAMDALAAAASVRQISRDLENGQALPANAAYGDYANYMNQREVRRRGGRNGR
jgi:hypothetical protein